MTIRSYWNQFPCCGWSGNKMKLALILFACIGASLAAPKPVSPVRHHLRHPVPPKLQTVNPRDLLSDFLEIIAVLPLDQLVTILKDHVANDATLSAVIGYLQSDKWNALVDEVLAKPTAVEFIDYLNNAGIPVDLIINAIRGIIQGATPGVDPDENGSLRPFLDEIEAAIPMDKLAGIINDKLQNSPDFQDLYKTIATDKGKALVDEVLQMEEAVYIQERLTAMGVDVAGVLAAVYDFFGWGAPPMILAKISPRDLLSDFMDIISVLPLDDMNAILNEHVASDATLSAIIGYLQSDAWNNLVDEVLAKPTAVEFTDYLTNAGIPVDMLIATIRGIIDGATPGVEPDENGSIRPFLDEIEATIPIDDVAAIINDKLQNSPDFQDLYTTIASEKGKALVDEVLQMEEAIYIHDRLTAMGADVDGVLAAIYEFFGWGAPPMKLAKISPRDLLSDFIEIIGVLPVNDLIAIVEDHLASDAAVSAVVGYLQSDAWNDLVDEVLAKPTAVEFIDYLNAAGIPVDLIIATIRGVIDSATPGVDPDENGSLRPFLDEFEAAVPVDELVAIINDKLQNSPDFQDLYTTIASEEGKALVDEVLQMEEAVYIQDRLTAMGVDVAGVLAAVYDFFGWGDPPKQLAKVNPRDLLGDFLEIIAVLPLDKLIAILEDHVASDATLSAVIGYLQSDKWNALVDEVLAKPTAVEFIDYLNNAGIPVDLIINAIRGIINGATPGVDPDENGSLRPFLDEIEAAIPVDDLVAIINDKLQNSPDFQDLYTTIASEKGKALVDEVLQMEEAVYIQDRLTAMGVDVAGVLAAVYDFFGWGEPPKQLTKVNPRDLLGDFLEIIAVLPLDKLIAILEDHVASDAILSAVIGYLQSDKWNALVDEVLAKPTAVEFIDYLNNAGIPVDLIINAIRGIIDGATPGVDPDENGSLRPFLDEIEAAIPVDELVAIVNDKLQNSPDFQDLYTTIASEKGKALVDEVLQMEEAVYIQDRLTAMGVDVAGVLAAVYDFFGWGAPPK